MRSSDTTLHKAVVHNVSDAGVYVKIPSLLGSSESIALYEPKVPNSGWPPSVGDQLLVAVEGDNFNRVYAISNIDNQDVNTLSGIPDGSITSSKLASSSVTDEKLDLYRLRVSRVAPQTGYQNVIAFIEFDTKDIEKFDTTTFITIPDTNIVATTPGLYTISATITPNRASGIHFAALLINNASMLVPNTAFSGVLQLTISGTIFLNSTDIVRLRIDNRSTDNTYTAVLSMVRIMD
jgi:hypothetical protein